MGSKGQSQTAQTQSYVPNPLAVSAIQGALGQAQGAAQLPFNIPQAPVAGFSPTQLAAFQGVNNAQGIQNPYLAQANNYFQQGTTPNVSQFFNPYAGAVGAQLQNIFGQQNVQNTGNLVQAAGGTGADRVAVGQANMANQQGLAAGQTFANLYAPSLSAAQQQESLLQGAGYGTAALGSEALNTALQGAQAQIGTGGLQQQLAQAQLNAPYQQQVAQAQFPYQQSNFLTNAVASLAPGLGGTTSGFGQFTPAQPSLFSQIGGAGLAGAGLIGGTGGFGSNGWFTNLFSNRGGVVNPYDDTIDQAAQRLHQEADFHRDEFAEGGAAGDEPIDVDSMNLVPAGPMARIAPHIPQINLNPPSGGGSGGKGSDPMSGILSAVTSLGKLAMLQNGGTVRNPYQAYDDGGDVPGTDMLRAKMIDAGYIPDDQRGIEDRFAPVKDAIATGAFDPQGINSTDFSGSPGMVAANQGQVPLPASRPDAAPAAIVAQSDDNAPDETPSKAAPTGGVSGPTGPNGPVANQSDRSGFADNKWLPLIAAGLGIMGGSSPFAGVNIGMGGLQGIKALQAQKQEAQKDTTIDQEAQKLAEEARQHQFAETQMTPYQQALVDAKNDTGAALSPEALDLMTDTYIAGDHSVVTGLGYGKQGVQNRVAFLNALQQKAAKSGLSGRDLAAAKVELMASTAGATTAARQQAGIDRAVIEAQGTFPLAEQASAAVPRGKWVPINQAMLAFKKGTSDDATEQFIVANQGVITAYAAAMGRGNPVTTVHAQQHAEELLSTAQSHEAYVAGLRQMQKEMQVARGAPAQVRQDIHNQITGQTGSPGGFTGRTAINRQTGQRIRETTDGNWVP